MKTVFRIIGLFLLLSGLVNLGALFFADMSLLQSPVAVVIRYTLLSISGAGYILLRKWGFGVYLFSVTMNWVLYFTLYGGKGSLAPLWLAAFIPLILATITLYKWDQLK